MGARRATAMFTESQGAFAKEKRQHRIDARLSHEGRPRPGI